MKAPFIALVTVLLVSPSFASPQVADAKSELAAATAILKAHHINRDKIDWPTVTVRAESLIRRPEEASSAYGGIYFVISQLGERHTRLVTADQAKSNSSGVQVGNAAPPRVTPPQGYALADGIGLIEERFMVGPRAQELSYAEAARAALMNFTAARICRFIIDLRNNTGGNMYPMIAGVSALLGSEPYGYFEEPGEPERVWNSLKSVGLEDQRNPAFPSWLSLAPVAVLIDGDTGSSGEFTAMAFKGRVHTRFFGEDTAGFVTANSTYSLPDGAILVVTSAFAKDRNRTLYRKALTPDKATPRGQLTLDAAVVWLKQQQCPVP
jgi:hypothetical protein